MLALHLLGVSGLFVALGAQAAGLAAVRGADTAGRLAAAGGLARRARLAFAASAAVVAVSGLYLLGSEEGWRAPWAWVSLLALAVAGAGGMGGTAAWLGRLRRAAAGPAGAALPPSARRLAQAGAPAWALGAAGGLLLGALWVMVLRPPLPGAAAVLLGGALLGVLVPAMAGAGGGAGAVGPPRGGGVPGTGSAGPATPAAPSRTVPRTGSGAGARGPVERIPGRGERTTGPPTAGTRG